MLLFVCGSRLSPWCCEALGIFTLVRLSGGYVGANVLRFPGMAYLVQDP